MDRETKRMNLSELRDEFDRLEPQDDRFDSLVVWGGSVAGMVLLAAFALLLQWMGIV